MNNLLYSGLPDDIDLDKLMEYDSIEDALQAYKTDPTPENKMCVLNIIAGEVCEMTGLDIDICSNECSSITIDRECPNCGHADFNECDCEED